MLEEKAEMQIHANFGGWFSSHLIWLRTATDSVSVSAAVSFEASAIVFALEGGKGEGTPPPSLQNSTVEADYSKTSYLGVITTFS